MEIFTAAVIFQLFSIAFAKTGCLDKDGNPVDWFTMYKLPKIAENPKTSKGDSFLYLDSNNIQWQFGNSVSGPSHGLWNTLLQIYNKTNSKDNTMHVMYNDQPPPVHRKVSTSYAHSKGVIAFDDEQGFWLVHSVPHFPGNTSYCYPYTGYDYGQSAMCLTLENSLLPKIVDLLLTNHPYVYGYNVPSSFKNSDIMSLITNEKVVRKTSLLTPLSSAGNQDFIAFAKTSKFNEDLYLNFVAPILKSSLYTETWQNGPHKDDMNSNCSSTYHVQNIETQNLYSGIEFTVHKDHSKFAVTLSQSVYYVCIGDINRQWSQLKRGGGTVCMNNKQLWQVYNQGIKSVEKCPSLG